jgi:hypothetical protein
MNVLFALGLGLTLLLTGCFAKVQTLPAQTDSPLFAPLPDPDVLVGLAVSGGGSRAATFAAGALEALAELRITREGQEHSVLETVTHMSSVSGGSLATAYYVVKKPPKSVPVLGEQGLSPMYRLFPTSRRPCRWIFKHVAVRQLRFQSVNPPNSPTHFLRSGTATFSGDDFPSSRGNSAVTVRG